MEAGRTILLMNLETLYESLYDLLNQVNSISYVCVDFEYKQIHITY